MVLDRGKYKVLEGAVFSGFEGRWKTFKVSWEEFEGLQGEYSVILISEISFSDSSGTGGGPVARSVQWFLSKTTIPLLRDRLWFWLQGR